MQRILRDPLLHFAMLGLGLFLVYAAVDARRTQTIALSDVGLAALQSELQSLTGRPVGDDAREALTRRFYVDEVLYREALARELHSQDGELRAVLIERMREDVTGDLVDPDDAQLVGFYADHIQRYYREEALSVDSLIFAERPVVNAASLQSLADASEYVDGEVRAKSYPDYGVSMLRGVLGNAALAAISDADVGQWRGPFQQLDRWHLYRVIRRTPRTLLSFEQAKTQVLIDYQSAIVDERVDAFVDSLAVKYSLRVGEKATP